ncbi:hypothetical protein SAMN05216188_104398 [Lentzea xinjiangensis]|uniref:Uncharacterized protein n=1 Tax=Lentzea xinjiangensis TaxID=402600 RepID=A0A1H9I8G8_9PSEU|nr:hypothetical protein [Lentzea xinjiangensis]SEQ71021.1 hypothetical protein SAMN05216188_104398 [Lentzea xinjiangensis]
MRRRTAATTAAPGVAVLLAGSSVCAGEARPFPSVPNFAPFRQKTSETLFANSPAELRSPAAGLKRELRNQKASQ